MDSPQVHPMEYPLNADSLARYWEADPIDRIEAIRWLWEEIAQLNAGIKFLEAIIDKAGAERDQWRDEAKASAEAMRQLRELMPKL